MQEKILVLGSNSFTGTHFIKSALEQGANVIGINRSKETHSVMLSHRQLDEKLQEQYQFFQLDINHDLDYIMDITQSFQPNYVVNFAAQGMVGQSWNHPEQWFQTNTLVQVALHERLRKIKTLKKYVQISTPEVYGVCVGRVKEHTHYQASTPYGVSKAAADMSLMSYLRAYQFPVVFTRAANVYGTSQQLYRIIPRTILYILLNKTLYLHGGGLSKRAFVHILDVADATLKIMRSAVPGSIYHLSTDEVVSIRQLVEMIVDIMGVRFEEHVVLVEEDRLGKDPEYLLDCTQAEKDLAWKPKYSLYKGLTEVIGWVESNIDILKDFELDYVHKI